MHDRPWVRLAAVALAVAALGLAGCGRKSGLDAPPAATAAVPQPELTPGNVLDPTHEAEARPSAAAPTGQRRGSFLDWLID